MTTTSSAAQRLVCVLDTTTSGLVHTGDAQRRAPSALRLTVGNPGTETLRCERVTLSLPVGDGPGSLTTDVDRLRLADPADGWQLRATGRSQVTLLPDSAGTADLAAGETRTLLLEGLAPHGSVGSVALDSTVHWTAAGVPGSAADTFIVSKTDVHNLLTNFRPKHSGIRNGETVEISWKGLPEKDRPVYRLFFDTTEIKADEKQYMDKDGNGKYTTPPLQRTTAFMMLVKYKGTDYGWTIAVTVSEPDLTVGRLTSNGVVQLLGTPTALLEDTSGETSPFTRTYKSAETDGLIAARLDCEEDGQAVDFLASVTSGTPPTTRATAACARTAWVPENVLVPVPRGAKVELSMRAEAGSFGGQITWFPFGTGRLKSS
ncbi:hypothetical protein [Kitasatospora sp. CB02891]|uniref:hypothetical protein n=1 Tax=Kitasatospora sp. CB02891 TaxID=2020329 RepID=UPI000C280AA8|nr:hypothetical protein [Kitasatospora sp. CB02891]PJN27775.1 hypothetical protein CG736_06065 [Kitasatospora sp. CB02891]